MEFFSPEYHSAVRKLERFGKARDRLRDRQPRQIILTDDEALAVLDVLANFEELYHSAVELIERKERR